MTLNEYTAEVNRLARLECDRINSIPGPIFGAVHHDFPESMMEYFFDRGFSPEAVLQATMGKSR
jgi:hypothetical protein